MSFDKTMIYFRMSAKTFLRHPNGLVISSIMQDFPAWRAHLQDGRNPVDDKMPWICFSAIRFIRKIVRPDMNVFEYGSGGSTLYWATHVHKIVSVEHDPLWFKKMIGELDKQGINNVDYILSEPMPDPAFMAKNYAEPDDYISSDPAYEGKSFQSYAKTIDKFHNEEFDVIVVDGRARPSCIKHAIGKLKKNGYLIIDNSERKYYLRPFSVDSSSWEIRKFAGPVPYTINFSETTILKKQF